MTGVQLARDLGMSMDDLDEYTFQDVLPYTVGPNGYEDDDWCKFSLLSHKRPSGLSGSVSSADLSQGPVHSSFKRGRLDNDG